MPENERLAHLLSMETAERLKELSQLSPEERREFSHHWRLWARDEQVSPPGDWRHSGTKGILDAHDIKLNMFSLNFANRLRRELNLPELSRFPSPPR